MVSSDIDAKERVSTYLEEMGYGELAAWVSTGVHNEVRVEGKGRSVQ